LDRAQTFHMFLDAVFLVVPMESLLDEEEVLSRHTGIKAEKGNKFFNRPLDHAQTFTRVSGGYCSCSTDGIPSPWRVRLVAQTKTTAKKGYNF
jgi:hypothetical protein